MGVVCSFLTRKVRPLGTGGAEPAPTKILRKYLTFAVVSEHSLGVARFFRHGELPLVVLALLEQRPMHSYGLLVELDRRFGDEYEPSTGTIYPAVSALAAEKLIEAASSNGDKRGAVYQLTPTGKAALAERSDLLTRLELRTGVKVRQEEDLDSMLERFSERVRAASARLDRGAIEGELDKTAGRIERLAESERSRHGD